MCTTGARPVCALSSEGRNVRALLEIVRTVTCMPMSFSGCEMATHFPLERTLRATFMICFTEVNVIGGRVKANDDRK